MIFVFGENHLHFHLVGGFRVFSSQLAKLHDLISYRLENVLFWQPTEIEASKFSHFQGTAASFVTHVILVLMQPISLFIPFEVICV